MQIDQRDLLALLGERDVEIYVLKQRLASLESALKEMVEKSSQADRSPQ